MAKPTDRKFRHHPVGLVRHNDGTFSFVGPLLFPLPKEYVAGDPVTVRVRANVAAPCKATLGLVTRKLGAGLGPNICATPAQALTGFESGYDFEITPAGLAAGDVLYLEPQADAGRILAVSIRVKAR